MFYSFVVCYLAVGVAAVFYYREPLRILTRLMFDVAKYDAPDFLSERQFEAISYATVLVATVICWPVMVPSLNQFK